MTAPPFAEIAINVPGIAGTFDYAIPLSLRQSLVPGHLVVAPFNKREVQGIVVRLHDQPAVEETLPIRSLMDERPVLTSHQLRLAQWMSANTAAPLIECLNVMLPPGLSRKADMQYTLNPLTTSALSAHQQRLVDLLQRRGPLRGRQLDHAYKKKNWRTTAQQLEKMGILSRSSVLDPVRSGPRKIRTVRLAVPPDRLQLDQLQLGKTASATPARRRAVLEMLLKEGEPVDVTWVYAETGANRSDLIRLEAMALIAIGESDLWRDPLTTYDYVPAVPPVLTPHQEDAWARIQTALGQQETPRAKPILLHGVTGSGKTELYMRAAAAVLEQGRSAIILVPEIALTPQTAQRFLARFPGRVGLMHSQLTDGERYDTWRRCMSGNIDIIIGARSALFTPFEKIGLIVLDESHDQSYKQSERAPRYHARTTAMTYAHITGATCILGTATPDIITMYQSSQGELELIRLPQRILAHQRRFHDQAKRFGINAKYKDIIGTAVTRQLPPVRIVDMKQELRAGNTSLFSRPLQTALRETIDSGQQAILFLNRRGSSTYIFCRDCGWVLKCPHCDVPLTHHQDEQAAICHHCGHQTTPPARCPTCNSTRVKYFGAGTEHIQTEVQQLIPDVQIIRWDSDTTRTRGAHEIILSNFAAHKADVLIGTQMIAKGLDLPMVTLVGIISADVGLNLPDYRMTERTFQTLMQVAGRAGRGILDGRVILQTFYPEHPVILAASQHDYAGFYSSELNQRRLLGYPPFTRLVRLLYRSESRRTAEREARRMANAIRSASPQAELIGPAPCFFHRLRGKYRWQLILRNRHPQHLIPDVLPDGWIVDIDPTSLL